MAALFVDLAPLTMQYAKKQNTFKLSYYVELDADSRALLEDMTDRLTHAGIRAKLIWSIDKLKHVGLLDILLPQQTNCMPSAL